MAMVSNLKSASGDWHKELILQNFLPEESAHILPILSLAVDSPDILNWSLDCFGIYSPSLRNTNIVASSCPAICPTPPRWSFPTLDCFKLNTDVATDYTNKVVGLGSIICNDQGLMMAASLRKVAADNAEALGILSGIQLVVDVSVFPFLVESDSKVVVGLINGHGVNRTSLGLIVDSIRKLASSMLCSLRDQEQVSTTK
ncbi:hypothetical protein ACOSQ3_021048 [Xanthoceras sorbifolium]